MNQNRTRLYTRALKMLSETNIYDKPVSDIGFGKDDKRVSLIEILKHNITNSPTTLDISDAFIYSFIEEAMEEYLSQYPAPYSFKKRVKTKFGCWLKDIKTKYSLLCCEDPEWVNPSAHDVGISMLKAMHSREGVTKEELVNELNCDHPRTVQKYLRRISEDLFEGESTKYIEDQHVPFYIGDQPIRSKIKIIKKKSDRKRYYYTPNTIHPIILQENLMQVGALLTALFHNYNDYESSISSLIAIDVWSQLSDYAKRRIKLHYALNNKDFEDFIEMLEQECPDDHACNFRTERDLFMENEMLPVEQLEFLSKGENRTCRIMFKDNCEKIYTNQRVCRFSRDTLDFTTVDREGFKHIFNYYDVDIILE